MIGNPTFRNCNIAELQFFANIAKNPQKVLMGDIRINI